VSFDGLATAPSRDHIVPQTAERADIVPSSTGQSTGLALALPRQETVVVEDGDSVSKIASRTYGQASHTILDLLLLANPSVTNVDIISTGQKLQLPQLDEGFVVLRQDDGNYALLLLSTPAQSQAERVRSALQGHGFKVRVAAASLGPGRSINRVLVSDLTSRDAALMSGRKLQQLFRDNVQIATMAR
jgi:phage tail protein X